MKTEEDEAFDELAKKQGDWGGGFPAKRKMAADKFIAAEERKVGERYGYVPKLHPSEWMNAQPAQESVHWSDCAVHNGPAYPAGECDCGAAQPWNEDEWRRNNWRCSHGWLRGEQCEICNAAQEPPSEWAGIKEILDEYGLQAIDFVADFKAALAQPPLPVQPPQSAQEPYDQTALELCNVCGWKTLIPDDGCLNCERAQPVQDVDYWIREATAARQAEMAMRRELEAQPAQEPVCAIEKPKLMLEKFLEMKDLLDDTTPPAPQPAQEPVAWTLLLTGEHHGIIGEAGEKFIGAPECYQRVNVYTTPSKREWVDLSDSQIEQVYHDVAKLHRGAAMPWGQIQFGRALQALIKEKNT